MNLGLRPAASPARSEQDGTSLATATLRCRTAFLRVCRLPALSRPDRPLALFLPDILTDLPEARRTAGPLAALFDVTVCELPGHGASEPVADASLPGLAQEYATLVDVHVPAGRCVTVVGAGFGGLVALELARLRSQRVSGVILLDTPFMLTRRAPAKALAALWRRTPTESGRRLLEDVFGIEPETGEAGALTPLHELVEDIEIPCAIVAGWDQGAHPSMLTDGDLDALHAINGGLLMPPRIEGAGHALLDDDPAGCTAMLGRLLAADQCAAAG